jgi:hypothetical protein
MATQEIPRDEWTTFLDRFSQQHERIVPGDDRSLGPSGPRADSEEVRVMVSQHY